MRSIRTCIVSAAERRAKGPAHAGDANLSRDLKTLLVAIHDLQAANEGVSLRDLHRITPFPQPRALRMVRMLEQEGLAEVEWQLHDSLSSSVAITPAAMEDLDFSRSPSEGPFLSRFYRYMQRLSRVGGAPKSLRNPANRNVDA